MSLYTIYHADKRETEQITAQIPLLAEIEEPSRQRTADALYTALRSGSFPSFEAAPFSRHSTHYRLIAHINEVAQLGMLLTDYAGVQWSKDSWEGRIDRQKLLQALILHDIDKYILLNNEELEKSIAHGVLGALILNELNFDSDVVELVAGHSPKSPLHREEPMAMILHYCDSISCDHIYMLAGRTPTYCSK